MLIDTLSCKLLSAPGAQEVDLILNGASICETLGSAEQRTRDVRLPQELALGWQSTLVLTMQEVEAIDDLWFKVRNAHLVQFHFIGNSGKHFDCFLRAIEATAKGKNWRKVRQEELLWSVADFK